MERLSEARSGESLGEGSTRASSGSPELTLLRSAKKIGFLFSGGSARCIFQVGVVEELFALGITPYATLGVSGGAWNAAAVAAGNGRRLRAYWRFFCRMPYIDLTNLARDEHSPFIWPRLHARGFARYIQGGFEMPVYIGVTRLRDRANVIFDLREARDPFRLLLASNYLPPFYTHPLDVDGEQYGDGGWTNNLPYEALFERGCDAVVLITMKGESEGGLHRHADDFDHEIAPQYRDRVVVIRPRHRMPLGFVERRWEKLLPILDLGALRTREILLGERHAECDLAARGRAFSAHLVTVRDLIRRASSVLRRDDAARSAAPRDERPSGSSPAH
jgi:predicted acylesterase/phospholipase RssA